MERLVGLTEMFPDSIRNIILSTGNGLIGSAKWTLKNGRSFAWVITSSSMIALMPVILERERHQLQQEQLAQQRQILLGPGATTPGAAGHSMYGNLVPPGLSK